MLGEARWPDLQGRLERPTYGWYFAGVDTGVNSPKLVVPEVAVGSASNVPIAESQVGTPQTIQRVESSLIPASGDITMGEAPELTIPDSGSGLLTFLACF